MSKAGYRPATVELPGRQACSRGRRAVAGQEGQGSITVDLESIQGVIPGGQHIQELAAAAEGHVHRVAAGARDAVDSTRGEQG